MEDFGSQSQKRVLREPVSQLRAAAHGGMKGQMATLFCASLTYLLCLGLPVLIIEQIMGLWDVLEEAMAAYLALFRETALLSLPADASQEVITDALNDFLTQSNAWSAKYAGKTGFSFATMLYTLFVPGALTLGLSSVWLRALRRQEIFSGMVFSGFENFFRAMLLNFTRNLFMIVWSILLLFPGVIAYYRYSLAFFLLADNPNMPPFTAIALSKYYMQGNKGRRFLLDLSFLGWFLVSLVLFGLVCSGVLGLLVSTGTEPSLFMRAVIECVCGSVIFAPLLAYRGLAAAEYYHRVICKDPSAQKVLPQSSSSKSR